MQIDCTKEDVHQPSEGRKVPARITLPGITWKDMGAAWFGAGLALRFHCSSFFPFFF